MPLLRASEVLPHGNNGRGVHLSEESRVELVGVLKALVLEIATHDGDVSVLHQAEVLQEHASYEGQPAGRQRPVFAERLSDSALVKTIADARKTLRGIANRSRRQP